MKEIQYRRDLWKVIKVRGNAAEIGVAEGNFSRDMLSWTFNRNVICFPIVYMVDRWKETPHQKGDASMPQSWHDENLRQAIVQTSKFGDRAQILQGNSVDMAGKVPDQSLALVYIDGDHSFEGISADIEAWRFKLVKGGVLAFHDYENPNYGVKAAVEKYIYEMDLPPVHLLPEDKPEDAGAFFIC
jgi:hypothetical protein